jgi:hypothetical protein
MTLKNFALALLVALAVVPAAADPNGLRVSFILLLSLLQSRLETNQTSFTHVDSLVPGAQHDDRDLPHPRVRLPSQLCPNPGENVLCVHG